MIHLIFKLLEYNYFLTLTYINAFIITLSHIKFFKKKKKSSFIICELLKLALRVYVYVCVCVSNKIYWHMKFKTEYRAVSLEYF